MPEMDMILERVQNKFACIIGELCSEPVVLSKFAIWLDLRLAEYKAKGAISLDCSGESPDPVWLKGHEKPLPVVQRSDDAYSPRNRMRPSMHEKDIQKSRPPESPAYDDEDRLSPGMVVIKEEAADETTDVFPISIHRVQPGSQNLNTRKRSLPDSLAPTQDSFSNLSPSKIRHVDNRLRTCEGVDNQSLMSIIQEAEDDNHSSNVTDSDFSVLMSSNQGTPVPSRGDNSLTFSPQNSSAPLHYSSSPSTSADDSSSVQQMMSFQSTQGELSFSQDSGQSPVPQYAFIQFVRDRVTMQVKTENLAWEGELKANMDVKAPREDRLLKASVIGLSDDLTILKDIERMYTKDDVTVPTRKNDTKKLHQTRAVRNTSFVQNWPKPINRKVSKVPTEQQILDATLQADSNPPFTDRRLLQVRPIDLEGAQIDTEFLEGLVESVAVTETADVQLEPEEIVGLVKKSQSAGHFAKNIMFRCFTIGELYGRNVSGRNFLVPGRNKKKAINRHKLKQVMDLVFLHFKEDDLEKKVATAINSALRYLWNVRLKFGWLDISAMFPSKEHNHAGRTTLSDVQK